MCIKGIESLFNIIMQQYFYRNLHNGWKLHYIEYILY